MIKEIAASSSLSNFTVKINLFKNIHICLSCQQVCDSFLSINNLISFLLYNNHFLTFQQVFLMLFFTGGSKNRCLLPINALKSLISTSGM